MRRGVNKAVVFRHDMTFGFTGDVAEFTGMPADQWLAQIRNEPDRLSALVNARVQGDVVWRQKIGLRRWRVAFVGAGFVDHPSRGVIPVQTVISDFMDHETGAWLGKPADWVMYILAMPPERRAHVKYAGAEIPATQLTATAATIEEKALGNPSYAADVLTGAIRQVATRNRTVSEDVLVSCIPGMPTRTRPA